jgi:predicted GTPase
MFMLKALTIAVAGIVTAAMLKQLMDALNAAKAKVAVKQRPSDPRSITRLRQDPQTGIYYPEH